MTPEIFKIPDEVKTAIFDMDGTIYQLDGENGGFKDSTLNRTVKKNTIEYFSKREKISKEDAIKIISKLNAENIFPSIYASEKYNITRKEFFNEVWNIDPSAIVFNYEESLQVISELNKMGLELILLTQAPEVWQNNVFKFLNIQSLFTQIYTGESYLHKAEIFPQIAKIRNPQTVISIGDQLDTDIYPAIAEGFYTFHVKTPKDLLKLLQHD